MPPPEPDPRPAHPLSCRLACKGIGPGGALGSLIRKVVTDALAAEVGEAVGCHEAEENATGPRLGRELQLGEGQRCRLGAESPPEPGTKPPGTEAEA